MCPGDSFKEELSLIKMIQKKNKVSQMNSKKWSYTDRVIRK